jgi:hypothetical protein
MLNLPNLLTIGRIVAIPGDLLAARHRRPGGGCAGSR